MKHLITMIMAIAIVRQASAQELFVVTEPASNVPAKSLGIRLSNYFSRITDTGTGATYHLMPEIKIGASKKLMLTVAGMGSNLSGSFKPEGISLYGKYRFLSRDEVQKHFRMATFLRWTYVNNTAHTHEVNVQMHTAGYEWGLVATQLLHKVALSASASYAKATLNTKDKYLPSSLNKVFNYTLSAGKLMLPAKYKDYSQTNLNLMLELLGQINLGDQRYYTDIVPSVQFIINSQSRLDFGWRKQLRGSLHRTSEEMFILKFEHTFFNIFK